jgi:hypothetical protein
MFAPAYALKVTKTGGGESMVNSNPAGIDCGRHRRRDAKPQVPPRRR